MATTPNERFIHSKSARLVALVLAGLIGLLFWFLADGALKELVAGRSLEEKMAVSEAQKKINPALDACLKTRIGHVDKLKSEGTINDSQYSSFKNRAEALCQAQNPS